MKKERLTIFALLLIALVSLGATAWSFTLGSAIRNTLADTVGTALNSGFIKFYAWDGTNQTTLLATLTFGNPAFGSAVNGTITANAITPDSDIDATGTAALADITTSAGVVVLDNLTVGTSGTNIVLTTTSLVQHATLSLSGFSYTIGP